MTKPTRTGTTGIVSGRGPKAPIIERGASFVRHRVAALSRATPPFKGKTRLFRVFERLVRGAGAPRIEEVVVGGVVWEVDPAELLAFSVLYLGAYGQANIDLVTREVERAKAASDARPVVVWDVGANVGTLAFAVAARSSGVLVEAFEPDPSVADHFARHLALNPAIAPRLRLHRFGLGSAESIVRFVPSPSAENRGTGHVAGAGADGDATRAAAIEVAVKRGVDVIASGRAQKPCVVKIDVEGYEPEVLDGLAPLLNRDVGGDGGRPGWQSRDCEGRPVLLIENDPRHLRRRGLSTRALVDRVTALGYACELVLPGATSRPLMATDFGAFFDFIARPIP